MKNITTKIKESSSDELKRLFNVVCDFCELLDECDDDSREHFMMKFVADTIRTDYTNGRCKECWEYVFENQDFFKNITHND